MWTCFNNQSKKISNHKKTLQTKTSNSDVKSVLKPIKQSNIITKEQENVVKPNIFDIELINMQDPKTITPNNQKKRKLNRFKSRGLYARIEILLKDISFLRNVHNVTKLKSLIQKIVTSSLTLQDLLFK